MPVVKLTPFRRPTFAMACVLNLVIGFGLYAATYLTPVYLGRVRGFSSLRDRHDRVRHRHRHDRHRRRSPRGSRTQVDGRYVIAVGFVAVRRQPVDVLAT